MNFYYHITKTGNIFHFVSNLTNWHFSVRKSYKEFWVEKTGSLSNSDYAMLKKAERLFQKYSYGDKFWGKVFLRRPEEDMWDYAYKFFGENDTNEFKEILAYFSPRFEKIWKHEYAQLIKWKQLLTRTEVKFASPELNSVLNGLFNYHPNENIQFKIVLLMCSPSTAGGGGANIGEAALTLEVSRIPVSKCNTVWMFFWHELVHSQWGVRGEYKKLLTDFINDQKQDIVQLENTSLPLKILVNEAVIESLFPYGYLARKYFRFDSDKYYQIQINKQKRHGLTMSPLALWRLFSSHELQGVVKDYVDNSKPIDTNYLKVVNGLLQPYLLLEKDLSINSY